MHCYLLKGCSQSGKNLAKTNKKACIVLSSSYIYTLHAERIANIIETLLCQEYVKCNSSGTTNIKFTNNFDYSIMMNIGANCPETSRIRSLCPVSCTEPTFELKCPGNPTVLIL